MFQFNDQRGVTTTLYTGANNFEVTSLVDRFQGLDYLPQWESPCNRIQNASLGFKIKANIGDEEGFLLYFRQLCRTLPFVSTNDFYEIPYLLLNVYNFIVRVRRFQLELEKVDMAYLPCCTKFTRMLSTTESETRPINVIVRMANAYQMVYPIFLIAFMVGIL